jgi:hypothetical protein
MTRDEWKAVHTKLNASYPHQQIPPETAAVWYEELAPLDAGEVWLAIRRHRRESRFPPSLAEILAAIDANFREMAEARRAQARAEARMTPVPWVPMPPETKEALRILAEASKPENGIDRAQARAMIESLGQQIIERALRNEPGAA